MLNFAPMVHAEEGFERRSGFKPRHIEILQCLINGVDNDRAIGRTMDLPLYTVRQYREHILSSIEDIVGEKSMLAAVKFAVKEGFIQVKDLRMPKEKLTRSELSIMALIVDLNTRLALCEALRITDGALKNHLHNLRKKFGVSNDYALVAVATTLALRELQKQESSRD